MRDLQSQTKYLEQSKKNPVKLDRIRRGCYYFWGEDWALGYIPLEFNIFLIFSYLLWPSVLGPFRGSWGNSCAGLVILDIGCRFAGPFWLSSKMLKVFWGRLPWAGWVGWCLLRVIGFWALARVALLVLLAAIVGFWFVGGGGAGRWAVFTQIWHFSNNS